MNLLAFTRGRLGRGITLVLAVAAVSVLAAGEASACVTCVSPSECIYDLCDGAQACSFDGPEYEIEGEVGCNLLYRVIFGCEVKYGRRAPSCRPSGGTCHSTLLECNPQSDLEPDLVDPSSPIGDDDERPGESPSA